MLYSKSITTDLGGNVTTHTLHDEIANSSIAKTLLRIDTVDDDIEFVFDSALSAGEQTTLDALIAAHTPADNTVYSHIVKFSPKNQSVKQTSFRREDTLIYKGSNHFGKISRLLVISYMESGVTSYTVRIYDKTNHNVIAESTFTNTSEQILDVAPITNVPTEEAVLELMIKKTGGTGNKSAHIDSVTMYMI